MARGGNNGRKPNRKPPTSMIHMVQNIPLNGVPGWQRKQVAVAHPDHWPYGTLDFSQPSEGQFSSVTSTYVASSPPREPSALTPQTPSNLPTHNNVPLPTSRRRRGAARNRIASHTPGTSNLPARRRRPSSDIMNSAAVFHPRLTTSPVSYAGISQQLHHGPEIQSEYASALPSGINISPSFVPGSVGTFESGYIGTHPSLVNPPPVAGCHSVDSSMSSYSTSPSDILSTSDFHQQSSYPDTRTYNSFMMNSSLSTQRQGSQSSSSLSNDSSVYEPNYNQRGNDYDFLTRANSQSSIAHAITANGGAGIHQGMITGNNPSFYSAEHHYSSSHSSSASTRSSPLDTFFSPTSYGPSGHVTHRLEDGGLQVQTYAGDMGLQNLTLAQNSFSSYNLPGGTGAETFDPYRYDTDTTLRR